MMEKPVHFILFIHLFFLAAAQNSSRNASVSFDVGVILDLGTLVGKIGQTSIAMAMDDFYASHSNYTTRLLLHIRDSKTDDIQAASAALDLLENTEVLAIIGPQKSSQAMFISDLGNRTQVPIASFSATSPSLSSESTPYFMRAAMNDSAQVNCISSIIKAYGWREVVLLHEDTDYGRDIVPYLTKAFQDLDIHVPYRSVISLWVTDDQIKEELYKLMTMQTRVFIVHMSAPLGSRLFSNAKEVGMISEGYAWIMTDGLTNIVDSLDAYAINSMHGALGVKAYLHETRDLNDFAKRWRRRFQRENPLDHPAELSIFGLWAYDTVWTLAVAAENIGVTNSCFQKPHLTNNSTSLEALGVSLNGPKLLEAILESRYRGLDGEFHLIDGQLQASTFQIINVIGRGGRGIGFWTPEHGLSRQLNRSSTTGYSSLIADLNPVIWPGESTAVPKGWEIPVKGKKLRIGVPVRQGDYQAFVKVETDPTTNLTSARGYSIDVFETVLQRLPYAIPHEYVPFENAEGKMAGTFNDLVYQVYLQKFDAVVGDVTIRYNRTSYVDFTLPYTDSGVSMIVPVKDNRNKNAWIFLKPLTTDLWLGSFAFFIFTGFVVWAMEHRNNKEFRGPISYVLGTVFYFSFSALVTAHREKVENAMTKIVVILWVFVVLILKSSYTASLTSMLTVQQLQPTVTDVHGLQENGEYVGYNRGSFVEDLLKRLNFSESKLRAYDTLDEYFEALSKGSRNGGVAAVVEEIPYIQLFLAKHCTGYTMVGPVYKTAGFGFVFPKGSPLVPDVSRGVLNVTDGDSILEIEKKWFGDQKACLNQNSSITSNPLTFGSFSGLFLITGVASTCALLISIATFIYKNRHELRRVNRHKPILHIVSWLNHYNARDLDSYAFRRDRCANPTTCAICRHAATTEAF